MLIPSLLFALSLAVLIGGAELLVRGATRIASICKISSLVIGLTVVSFGTSAPELAVCSLASLRGESDLLIGNIIGSNIFNILLVLGVASLITPLTVKKKLLRWDIPLMIGVSLLIWIFAWSGKITCLEGGLLFAGILLYIFFTIRLGHEKKAPAPLGKPLWVQILMVLAGLILLVIGANGFIKNALVMARHFGVSELAIGLTLAAVGTSLPELTTSIVAAIKGEKEIAIGNAIGSNLFNLLAVLGLSAMIAPEPIRVAQKAVTVDLPIMIAVSLLTLPVFFTGRKISRVEGGFFLLAYFAYLTYLFM